MSRRGSVGRARGLVRVIWTVGLLVSVAWLGVAHPAAATPYPPLATPGREFLSNLSVPSTAPGTSTQLSFTVGNPLNVSVSSAELTFGLYAFNGFPGDATAVLPVANAPTLDNGTASGAVVNVSFASLAAHSETAGRVKVVTSSGTPSGTFAIRTALSFTSGAQHYRLESRGWFSTATWDNATQNPNGSGTLNLTRLNISALVPETAVFVQSTYWPIVLGVLLAVGLLLVGLGAWVYFRRTSPSSSGTG